MGNKENLKEQCIQLYLSGKTFSEISKITKWSRTYITNLIKNDKRIIEKKNEKKIKVCKRKDNNQMVIYIPSEFIEKLGISRNASISEYVNISYNQKNNNIIISKA